MARGSKELVTYFLQQYKLKTGVPRIMVKADWPKELSAANTIIDTLEGDLDLAKEVVDLWLQDDWVLANRATLHNCVYNLGTLGTKAALARKKRLEGDEMIGTRSELAQPGKKMFGDRHG